LDNELRRHLVVPPYLEEQLVVYLLLMGKEVSALKEQRKAPCFSISKDKQSPAAFLM
jgi:hypothetical protein